MDGALLRKVGSRKAAAAAAARARLAPRDDAWRDEADAALDARLASDDSAASDASAAIEPVGGGDALLRVRTADDSSSADADDAASADVDDAAERAAAGAHT